jgi:hypothetical protein
VADERRDRGQGRPGETGKPGEGRAGEGNRRPDGGRPADTNGRSGEAGRDKRRFGRRRFGRGQGEGQQGGQRDAATAQDLPEARPKPDPVACPLCGKPVYDLSTALSADREKPMPAHFDCVVERVMAAESLSQGEKLVYLGSGSFGVVEFKDKAESAFTVKRRIQWEKEGDKQEWRRSLSSRIHNL